METITELKSSITINNFFNKTFGIFKLTEKPNREPDYISYVRDYIYGEDGYVCDIKNTDKISSMYWYEADTVYRYSDHWGSCASCYWELDSDHDGFVCGKINLSEFKEIKEFHKSELKEGRYLVYEFGKLHWGGLEGGDFYVSGHPNHKANYLNVVDFCPYVYFYNEDPNDSNYFTIENKEYEMNSINLSNGRKIYLPKDIFYSSFKGSRFYLHNLDKLKDKPFFVGSFDKICLNQEIIYVDYNGDFIDLIDNLNIDDNDFLPVEIFNDIINGKYKKYTVEDLVNKYN